MHSKRGSMLSDRRRVLGGAGHFEIDRPGTSEEVQIIPCGFWFRRFVSIRSLVSSLITTRIERCLI
jgi:hypothetical protein